MTLALVLPRLLLFVLDRLFRLVIASYIGRVDVEGLAGVRDEEIGEGIVVVDAVVAADDDLSIRTFTPRDCLSLLCPLCAIVTSGFP